MSYVIAYFLILLSSAAYASDTDCWNAEKTVYNCNNGHSGAAVGASAPLIGDTMTSNPAALPTAETPFGIEGIYSDRSTPTGRQKLSVSTVRGFNGIGFGIGSWSDGTFSAPDFPQHFLGSSAGPEYLDYQKNPPSVLGIRLGSSFLLPQGPFPKGIRFSLGGTIGLGRISGEWSPQVGILMRVYSFGFGYSENYERLSTKLPRTRITNFSAGLQLGQIYLGYSYATILSNVNKSHTNAFSMSWLAGKWTLHGGLKVQKDHRNALDSWTSGGLQRRFGKLLGAGYEYGYYRHSHSGVMQIYF